MGNVKDYINEKYYAFAGLASTAVGVASGAALVAIPGPAFLGAGGLVVGGLTGLAAVLLRPRTEAEIAEIEANARLRRNAPVLDFSSEVTSPEAHTKKGVASHLTAFMTKLEKKNVQDTLGQDCLNAVVSVLDSVYAVHKQWSKIEGMAEAEYTVENILTDYLPTSVTSYLNLPAEKRENEPEYKESFIEQMGILKKEADRILESINSQKVASFSNQNNFLKARFASNSAEQIELPADGKPTLFLQQ